jgi:hypothetical protein
MALAEFTSTRIKAAAAASAIALVQTKLAPGQSTDGAVFYNLAASLSVRNAAREHRRRDIRISGAIIELGLSLSTLWDLVTLILPASADRIG